MCAEENRGKICGKKSPDEIRERVVVMSRERVWRTYGVEVGLMQFAKVIRRLGMEYVAVHIVLENLLFVTRSSKYRKVAKLTSRSAKLLPTSLSMDHGIGRVVVTFKALLNPMTSVNSNSTPACTPTPRQILNRLKPIT